MKFSFQLQNVDNFEATATITMRICEWKTLFNQLKNANIAYNWPASDLADVARDIVTTATEKFEKETVVK